MKRDQSAVGKPVGEIIETSVSKIWLGADGICRVVVLPGVVVGLEEMKENLAVQIKVLGTRKTPTLVDIREIKNSTQEAREFAASEEYGQEVSAVAILSDTVVGMILGNLFINFSKPLFPTKLFTSEQQAVGWLQEYVQESRASTLDLNRVKNG